MSNTILFEQKAPSVMRQLMDDFELEVVQAAGVLGNIGRECNGFKDLRETNQPEGRGGYGWCQKSGLNWKADNANYGYLKVELLSSERAAVSALLKTTTLAGAVKAFERNFERAGTPNYASRNQWAALAAYKVGNSQA